MSWEDEAREIRERRKLAREMGGSEAVARHHAKGRLTVRERIAALVDEDTFEEHGRTAGYGEYDEKGRLKSFSPANYVTGLARIGGRLVAVGGEDFTLKGGSPNAAGLRKSVYAEELALTWRVPLVRLLEGGGGSIRASKGERPSGSPVYAEPRFASIARCLAEVPVASAALGPVAGFPAARLAASHFSVMAESTAQVMIGGPALVERALGQTVTKEELGGGQVHLKSGAVDNGAADEFAAIDQIRRFLSYLPGRAGARAPVLETTDPETRAEEELLDIVPRDRRKPFDMRKAISLVMDKDSFFEMTRGYGRGQITGLARLKGLPVGVLANDGRIYAGAMTADGAQKVRRFLDMCNNFGLPVVSFVDEPGFMIGPDSEKAGTIRHGTAAVMAAVQSRVPWASVIVRKAYGVAAAAHFGPEGYVLSWPSAETGALPLEGGVAVAFGRDIASADDPEAKRAELEAMLAAARTPFPAAETFSVHEIIDPRETREFLCRWAGWLGPRLDALSGPYAPGIRP
ncbi:MAG: acyl-CoA carboxylase subunit beta [Alphaproteobacteria bacterium]